MAITELDYLKNSYETFSLIDFYRQFKYASRVTGEKEFKAAVGKLRREGTKEQREWAGSITGHGFSIFDRIDVHAYWRKIESTELRDESTHLLLRSLHSQLEQQLNAESTNENDSREEKRRRTLLSAIDFSRQDTENCDDWSFQGVNITKLFEKFKLKSVQLLFDKSDDALLESSFEQTLAIQNILLLKPKQHGDEMRGVFGDTLLASITSAFRESWTRDCPFFTKEEVSEIGTVVDAYQTSVKNKDNNSQALKKITAELAVMVLEMDPIKTCVVNAIRRLIENIPITTIKQDSPSETEIWSTFSDPILRSLFNLPDQYVHLRWSNKKVCSSENNIRPDSTISSRNQLQWSHDWGFGEAKTYEPTHDNHALAKDIIRIAMFNKSLINKANIRATIGFQINGFRITFYIIELNFHAIYTMNELCHIDIPQSIEQIDQITTNNNLRVLAQVAHAFDMIRNTSLRCTADEFEQKKTKNIKFEDLESLISKKRDRHSPCSSRF